MRRFLLFVALTGQVAAAAGARRVTDDQGCNKGIDANNELDGEIVCKFPDGKNRYEGQYAHGKRAGIAKTWRADGKLASVEHFEAGERSGLCEEYDREGSLDEACEYKAGRKDGPCKLYGPGGKLREERRYVAGDQRGPWTSYHLGTGKVQERGVLDEDGRRHGLLERFRADGGPEEATPYVHGQKEGVEREWHPNGKPRLELSWKADRQHGLMRDFHETGQLSSESCYQNGSQVTGTNPCTGKTGPELLKHFFPDGKPYETVAVKDGKRSGERQLFDASGALKVSEHYAADELDGPQRLYKAGKLERQVTWKAGKKHGPETTYFEDGKVSEETGWEADRRTARTTWWMNGKKRRAEVATAEGWRRQSWYDTGQLETEDSVRPGRYRDERDGLERRWSETAVLLEERSWKAGRAHGVQKTYFEKSGKPASVEEWADGVRQSRKEWDEAGEVVRDERYNPDGSRK